MTENGIGDFFITDADEVAEIGGIRVPPVIVPSRAEVVAPATEPEPDPEPDPEPELVSAPTDDADAEPLPTAAAPVRPEAEPEGAPGPAPAAGPPSTQLPVVPETAATAVAATMAAPAVATAEKSLADASVPMPAPQVPEVGSGVDESAPMGEPRQLEPVGGSPESQVTITREQKLIGALDGLMAASDDIEAAALVSLDGFIMASALPEGMIEDKVGAMSAAILGLGERAAIELGRGNLTQVFIEGEGGYVLLIAVADRAVLTVLASERSKLGLVLYDMRAAAETIAQLLG